MDVMDCRKRLMMQAAQKNVNLWHSDFVSDDTFFTKSDGVFVCKTSTSTSYLLGGSQMDINFELPPGTYKFTASSETFSNIFARLGDGSSWYSGTTKTFSSNLHIWAILCSSISPAVGTHYWNVEITAET